MSSDGGSTLYVGARSSERFGRVYDKGVESGDAPAGRWFRWEVELKQRSAERAGRELEQLPEPEAAMLGMVTRFFLDRLGAAPPASAGAAIYNGTPEPTSDDKLLQWLAVGVRPTVAELISRHGLQRVATALGLPLKSAVHEPSPHESAEGTPKCQQ